MKYLKEYDRWVTKQGLVYRLDKKNDRLVLCSPCKTNGNYLQVRTKEGMRYIHRMIATAFITNKENLPQVDHIDRDVSNNSVENLRWCSCSQNSYNRITTDNRKKKGLPPRYDSSYKKAYYNLRKFYKVVIVELFKFLSKQTPNL